MMLFFSHQDTSKLEKCHHFLYDRLKMAHSKMPFIFFKIGNYVNILSNQMCKANRSVLKPNRQF